MSIRNFYRSLYEAIDYMSQFPELSYKRKSIEERIEKTMTLFLSSGIKLDEEVSALDRLNNKDIAYLRDFLILGYLVDQGVSIDEAYDQTLGRHTSKAEAFITKKMVKEKYFRKLTTEEVNFIKSIYVVYK